MAAVTDAVLTKSSDSKSILLRAVSSVGDKKSQPSLAVPFVNLDPTQTPLYRFFGQSEVVTFSCGLFYDGTDVSNGTSVSSIETTDQQITWLRDSIFTADFDETWSFTCAPLAHAAVTVVIENIDIQRSQGQTGLAVANITIRLGSIGLSGI